ncbi:MAG TPA: indolepyruvate ferredoxin oxidoreductase family protein [Usitatibacter sp.]|nr:indolepyruvate ferredoxin oxidoreductase family protein [Usitatibacter sp.]
MSALPVTLEDKYKLASGRIYLTGTQALVRLAMIQRERDLAAGLNTAGFISGYRGSPLGGFDQALWKAKDHLREHHIHFVPGVNEEVAATSVWGSQQVGLFQGAKYDGVFAMWYGKGPGVDRCGDVFKHANAAGTSKHGGVLAIAGDDHACKSSTLPHQSEHAFDAAMIPVLYPCGVQEIIDLGLHGFAMSRYSGCWVAFKCVTETVETSASIHIDPESPRIVLPEDFPVVAGGLNIRWPDQPMEQEYRLQHDKIYAALAYCRANKLNRIAIDSPRARFGIVASGKSYLDVLQALRDLGIDERVAADIGIRVYKVSMPWPLEPNGIREFAQGLEEVLVVEEKRQLIEYQMKEQLYNWPDAMRPRVVGKYDEHGEWEVSRSEWLLPAAGELTPAMIARAIASRIAKFHTSPVIEARLKFLEAKEAALAAQKGKVARIPYFCSGCPHSSSTKVPQGSKQLAGIGCHYMAIWVNPDQTMTFTQMGGEGAPWIGIQPFTETRHIFANIGDGTYFHSGLLAIRGAASAGVNITYKILFNDAVAMTGGQPHDGPLTVPAIVEQVKAEGAKRVVVVTDEPDKYKGVPLLAGTTVHHRDDLDAVQRELREIPGLTVLVYDQTCAAEKRRRRKRGKFPDPAKRVVINDLVCEGCGDCGVKSNCLSVVPLETEYGRKRTIDQSTCNKDYSCLKGFCPSFVTVEGGKLRKRTAAAQIEMSLPTPALPELDRPYGILVTGIGGTGVVTIGAILGMAAHIEGKGIAVLDMAGLAQKGGSVYSHIRIAQRQEDIHAVRIAAGDARLVLGCDMVVAASEEALAKMQSGSTRAVINADVAPIGTFTKNPDQRLPLDEMVATIREACGENAVDTIDATGLATGLVGDSIATNLFVVGFAWQKGLIPLSEASIVEAIRLNATAVESNIAAFEWGRRAACDSDTVHRAAKPAEALPESQRPSHTLDELISRRSEFLTAYQSAVYARQYTELVDRVRRTEAERIGAAGELTQAVARYLFKLMAYKDEYEVARLHTDTGFLERIARQFEGDYEVKLHLAPPLWAKPDPATGEPRKRTYGPWMFSAMRMLAALRFLRGTPFDAFGYSRERRMERQLVADYRKTIDELLQGLKPENLALAVEIASVPEMIRGFGSVKARHLANAKPHEAELLERWRYPEKAGARPSIPIRAAA